MTATARWEAAGAAAAEQYFLGDGSSRSGATAARRSRSDGSVGEAAVAEAQRRWRVGQLRQRWQRAGAGLGLGTAAEA